MVKAAAFCVAGRAVAISRAKERTVGDPCGSESADAQHELLERCDCPSDGGMAQLCLVDGDDHDHAAHSG